MVADLTVLELIKKDTDELMQIKSELELFCDTIDYVISQRKVKDPKTSDIETKGSIKKLFKTKIKEPQKLKRNRKISKELEELMEDVISEFPKETKISELYDQVKKECQYKKLDAPSLPTFSRRYHSYYDKKLEGNNKPKKEEKKQIEKVNVGKIKSKYKEYRQREDLEIQAIEKGF